MSNNDASLGEGGTTRGSSQRPQDYFDYARGVERRRSSTARTASSPTTSGSCPGPKSGVLKQVLGGWQVSGVTQFQSGRPFTILTGVDSNGDGNTGSDRPNINPSGTFVWDDDHKRFTNNGYYTAPLGSNNLPLANALGNGNAPRNSERGAAVLADRPERAEALPPRRARAPPPRRRRQRLQPGPLRQPREPDEQPELRPEPRTTSAAAPCCSARSSSSRRSRARLNGGRRTEGALPHGSAPSHLVAGFWRHGLRSSARRFSRSSTSTPRARFHRRCPVRSPAGSSRRTP